MYSKTLIAIVAVASLAGATSAFATQQGHNAEVSLNSIAASAPGASGFVAVSPNGLYATSDVRDSLNNGTHGAVGHAGR